MSGNATDDPAKSGEATKTMSVKIDTDPQAVERTEQFRKFQTLAVTSQSIPLTTDLRQRLLALEKAAENGNADLEDLATLLRHFSDEMAALAALADESPS
jgi:hypothetical protein